MTADMFLHEVSGTLQGVTTTGFNCAAKAGLNNEQGLSVRAAKAAAASAAAAAAALGSALAFAAAALLSAGDRGGGLGGASNTCHCTGLRSHSGGILALLTISIRNGRSVMTTAMRFKRTPGHQLALYSPPL